MSSVGLMSPSSGVCGYKPTCTVNRSSVTSCELQRFIGFEFAPKWHWLINEPGLMDYSHINCWKRFKTAHLSMWRIVKKHSLDLLQIWLCSFLSHPSTKFCGNLLSSFCVILLTNKQMGWKHHINCGCYNKNMFPNKRRKRKNNLI